MKFDCFIKVRRRPKKKVRKLKTLGIFCAVQFSYKPVGKMIANLLIKRQGKHTNELVTNEIAWADVFPYKYLKIKRKKVSTFCIWEGAFWHLMFLNKHIL